MSLTSTESLAILLICISSSTDNLSVGATYELSKKSISLFANVIMAAMNAVTTLVTMKAGLAVFRFLDPNVASSMGAFIFILLGLNELLRQRATEALYTEVKPKSKREMTMKETILVGLGRWNTHKFDPNIIFLYVTIHCMYVGLCFTNIAGGIAAGLAGYDVFLCTMGE